MRGLTYDFTHNECVNPVEKCAVCGSVATKRMWYRWVGEPRDADDPFLAVCDKHAGKPKQWERLLERRHAV